MKTFLFVFFVTATIGFIPSLAQSAITGSQCQSHLAQVTDILKRENLQNYWAINDEITNVLGTPLNKMAGTQTQDPVVEDFVNAVKTTVRGCQANCGGVTDRNGRKLSCEELGNKTVLDVNLIIRNIDGDLIVENFQESAVPASPLSNAGADTSSQLSDSPCDGGIQTDSCQVYLHELEQQRKQMSIKAAFAMECARQEEKTDTCQALLYEMSGERDSQEVCLLNEDCGENSLL